MATKDIQEHDQHLRDKQEARRFKKKAAGEEGGTVATDFVTSAEHDNANLAGHDLLSETTHVHQYTPHGELHEDGETDAIAIDAAAGTGSLRTLGTTSTKAAAGDHTHTETFHYSFTAEDPTSSEDISIAFTNVAITITEIRAVLVGSSTPSVTWTIRHGTDRSATGAEVVTGGTATTSTTTGSDVTSFNDATIVADSFIWFESTAQSGTVTELHLTIIGTVD